MSRICTIEQDLLSVITELMDRNCKTYEERLELLEEVAALYSGADVSMYRKQLRFSSSRADNYSLATLIQEEIDKTDIPKELALSSLAREPLTVDEQKKNGVFYTDFRLGEFMGEDCVQSIKEGSSVVDFACGTGMLLLSVARRYYQLFPCCFDDWISDCVFAFDLSPLALRGAALGFLSMTKNITSLRNMYKNWSACDSLLDERLFKQKFDIVVGNPPWGKVKISRHTYLLENGSQRVYGENYEEFDKENFLLEKAKLQSYSQLLKSRYTKVASQEIDMYMVFMQKAIDQAVEGGHISILVPAGIIRSEGTKELREYLFQKSKKLKFNLITNAARFFSIDTRFKFVLLSMTKSVSPGLSEVLFSNCSSTCSAIVANPPVRMNVMDLSAIRSDLTIPEVNTNEEWELFLKLYKQGCNWKKDWAPDIKRELDMTNDSEAFVTSDEPGAIPVIEGRMVQQFRFGAKKYIEGKGRSAKWEPTTEGCFPQYYANKSMFASIEDRISRSRIGYCDIAGQTNERTMMSSVIPPNVICGNKVPTIIFPHDNNSDYSLLWVGITNSFIFDWMLRRIVSTTVNYFLLFSIPFPKIDIDSDVSKEIIARVKKIYCLDDKFYSSSDMAELRAEIDSLVAMAYGITENELEIIMDDFPLLDRKQPALPGETKSTVTKDCFLSRYEVIIYGKTGKYSTRYIKEKSIGAKAYIPTEMTCLAR